MPHSAYPEKRKKRNKCVFLFCSYSSIFAYKLSQFMEKISFFCSKNAYKKDILEEIIHKEKVLKTYDVGKKVVEHKEEIKQTLESFYKSIEECEKDNDFLIETLFKIYIHYQNKEFEKIEEIFENLSLKKYVNYPNF